MVCINELKLYINTSHMITGMYAVLLAPTATYFFLSHCYVLYLAPRCVSKHDSHIIYNRQKTAN